MSDGSKRSSDEEISPVVILVLLVAAGLWTLIHALADVLVPLLLVGVPVGVVVTILWRRSLPHRATRVLKLIATGKDGKRPRLRRLKREGAVWHLAWKVPVGVTVSALLSQREVIEQALDGSVELWYDRGRVHMRVGTARLPDVMDFLELHQHKRGPGALPLGIGVGRAGLLTADLAELPHLLVGGSSGGGKTAFLRQAITGLVLRMPPERLRLALIDLKGMEFGLFERLPHMLGPAARELDATLDLLAEVCAEMDRRQAAFAQAGVQTLSRWNAARPAQARPYIVVVVDECAELSAAEVPDRDERARRQKALAYISRLCRLGRASGIHVILSTQRPDADAVPGQIKNNLLATVAFRVRGATNSRILLGEGNEAAAVLPPWPGRGVWQWDTETQFQAPWLSPAAASALLEEAYPTSADRGTVRVSPCPESPRQEAA